MDDFFYNKKFTNRNGESSSLLSEFKYNFFLDRTQHSKPQMFTLFHSGSSTASGDTLTYSGPSFSSSSSSSGCSSVASTSSNFSQLLPDHPMLIKQDPVLMSSDENDHDLILDDSLQLFENASLMDSGDSAIHLSLDDIASFTNTIVANDGSHASFDTSIETSSFLSGADALDMMSETTNAATPISLTETQNESRTPSLPDDGEFPCSQVPLFFC